MQSLFHTAKGGSGTSFSKCCFPRCVSQTKHFWNPQRGSKIAQSWGVWDLLHSVPKIKAIQVVNTILWVLWACWVSQSLSKLLLPNKLGKTSECFKVCGWIVQCGGSFTYCCLSPKPLKQGEGKVTELPWLRGETLLWAGNRGCALSQVSADTAFRA